MKSGQPIMRREGRSEIGRGEERQGKGGERRE